MSTFPCFFDMPYLLRKHVHLSVREAVQKRKPPEEAACERTIQFSSVLALHLVLNALKVAPCCLLTAETKG